MTGIDSPYEAPEQPRLRVDTSVESIDDAVARTLKELADERKF